jgi:diacylglycerol kinase (ATP)
MAVTGMLKGFDARGRIELARPAREFPPMIPARSRPDRTTRRLELDQRRIRVLWNRRSGRKGGLPTNYSTFDTILDLMGRNGLGEELIATTSEEEAIEQAQDAVAHDYDVVVAAGGDGTIGVVGRQLLGTRCALGILPAGSIMNIPRMLGLSREMERAAEVISAGFVRAIDVGQVGDRIFYETASVALYAAAARDLALVDDGDYGAILRSLEAALRFRPSEMTIELDGDRTIETAALLVVVANGPYMGAGLTVAPEASLDDGLFDVRIFTHETKAELTRYLASVAFGRHVDDPRALTERAATVRITSLKPLPAHADSHDLGTTPVVFRSRAGVLRVLAPDPRALRSPRANRRSSAT